jgi:hypothetical protein
MTTRETAQRLEGLFFDRETPNSLGYERQIQSAINILDADRQAVLDEAAEEIEQCRKHNGEIRADFQEDFDRQLAEIDRLKTLGEAMANQLEQCAEDFLGAGSHYVAATDWRAAIKGEAK